MMGRLSVDTKHYAVRAPKKGTGTANIFPQISNVSVVGSEYITCPRIFVRKVWRQTEKCQSFSANF